MAPWQSSYESLCFQEAGWAKRQCELNRGVCEDAASERGLDESRCARFSWRDTCAKQDGVSDKVRGDRRRGVVFDRSICLCRRLAVVRSHDTTKNCRCPPGCQW